MTSDRGACLPHVVHVLPWPNIGGTEIATKRLIDAAATHGYRASVLHRTGATPVREMFVNAGIPAYEYAAPEPSYRHATRYLAESRVLAGALKDLDAHLVHCADVASAFHVALAARLAGVATVSHVRNRYRTFPPRLRPVLRMVDHFVFVSEQTRAEFGHRVARRRASVLYDGIAVPAARDSAAGAAIRHELGIRADDPLVGMVARVARQKDFETLSRAAATVLRTSPNARFVVVGDHEAPPHRSYYAEIRQLLGELGILDRFAFPGHRTDIPSWLAAFDVFVLSTHWEGFPLVILEAMAAGLPVVATAVDGIPEVVRPDLTGLLVPPGDSAALAAAIGRLVADEPRRMAMGAAARAHVGSEFSQDRFTRDVGVLYRRLLADRPVAALGGVR